MLTLYIPGWVETDQIARIARLVAELDPAIPFTLLAFFPAFQMQDTPRPTLGQMLQAYEAVKETGLQNARLGNCGVFARSEADWDNLLAAVGQEGIG